MMKKNVLSSSPLYSTQWMLLCALWRKLARALVVCAVTLTVAACGGSGGSSGRSQDALELVVVVAGPGATTQSRVTSNPAGIDCGSTCTASYPGGTAVTLTTVAGPGERLAAWSGACSGAASVCVVALNAATTVEATFTNESTGATVALGVAVTGNGSVNSQPAGIACRGVCSADFNTGVAVALTATPDAGQVFAAWGGACSGAVPTCQVRMSDARSVTAAFEAAPPSSDIGWSDTTVLSADGAGKPRVGIDAAGNATMIWLQLEAGTSRRNVWTSRKPTGGAWSAPSLLEAVDTDFFELDLAVDAASGKAVAVWRGGTTPVIYGRLADAAGNWGATASLNGVGNNINDLQAGIDTNGNAVAVWSQTPTGSTAASIWSNRYTAANGWGGAVRVSVAANDRQDLDPSLAVSAAGRAFIVWTRNGTGVVASQAEATGGVWSEPTVLAAGVVSTGVGAPRVAADANGNAMAVWAQGARDANSQIVTNLASKRFVNGAWGGTALALYTPILTNVLAEASMAVNGVGQFAVIWAQSDASIRAVQSSAAGVWTIPLVVRPAITELYGVPEIAIDSTGNMFATWAARANTNPGTPEVWLNQFSLGSGWGPSAIHQTSAEATGEPRITMNDRGQAAIGWTCNGNDGSRVISRYFSSGR
jgi:Divergent InlB B-repeat domain